VDWLIVQLYIGCSKRLIDKHRVVTLVSYGLLLLLLLLYGHTRAGGSWFPLQPVMCSSATWHSFYMAKSSQSLQRAAGYTPHLLSFLSSPFLKPSLRVTRLIRLFSVVSIPQAVSASNTFDQTQDLHLCHWDLTFYRQCSGLVSESRERSQYGFIDRVWLQSASVC